MYPSSTFPLWTDIKGATDQFMLGDKHYVSVIRTDPAYVFVYNKQTMEDNGYDDPAELFKEALKDRYNRR